MDSLRKLEETVGVWYKNMPHLPKNGQRWLAENAWWIVLIGVILGVLGIFSLLSFVLAAGFVLAGVAGIAGAALGGFAIIATLVSIALGAADVVIAGIAISPLKSMQRKGWSLLFLTVVINVAALVLNFLFTINFFGLVWGLLVTAVGVYFLYEVRDYFVTAKAKPAKK